MALLKNAIPAIPEVRDGDKAPGGTGTGLLRDRPLRRAVRALRIPVLSDNPAHDPMLDALKGWAILLVVLGHAIASADANVYLPRLFARNLVFIFAYSFHMPLFIFISGFIAYGKPVQIARKARRLLLPCLCWFFVYYFVFRWLNYGWKTFVDFSIEGLRFPRLWFLWVLFICFAVLGIVKMAESRRAYLGWGAFLVIYVAVNLIPTQEYGMIQLKYLLPIFYLGYVAAKHRDLVDRVGQTARKAIPFVVLALYPFLFAALFKQITPASDAAILSDLYRFPGEFFSRYALAFLGIAFSYCLLRVIRHTFVLPVLAWFGLLSLDIYVSHVLFLQLAVGTGTANMLSGFIFGVVCPIVLSLLVLRQSRVLGTLLLGLDYRSQPVNALVARVRSRRNGGSAIRKVEPGEGAREGPRVE